MDTLTLPDDLTDDERAVVEAFQRPAYERAAIVVTVRRAVDRLRARGLPVKAAFAKLYDDGTISLSPSSIEDAYRQRKAFAV